MYHYDSEPTILESIRPIDRNLAVRMAQWNKSLPDTEYRDRIRSLVEDLDDCRHWEDVEGDRAASLHFHLKDHYDSLSDR